MILVTGGTGLVGSHLLVHLIQKDERVRAIYRNEEKIENTRKVFSYYSNVTEELFAKIEWIEADITDVPSMMKAFDGITHVYHCAALISFDPKDYIEMRKVNIHGTATIANLSIDIGVKKLCYVSSIAAIGENPHKEFIDEENEWNGNENNHGYAITKYGAEMEIWRASQEGIDVVIVNPGVILGSGFWNSGSGTLFRQVYNGFKFYTKGIAGFVGVRDVVLPMIQLMNNDHKNERYILVSENKSFKEVLFSIADSFQKKRPSIYIKPWQTAVFWRIDWLRTKLTRKSAILTKQSAKSTHEKTYYDAKKLKKALNYEFEEIDDVIQKTCQNYLL